VNIPAKFEVRSFTRSWDKRGYWTNYVMRVLDKLRDDVTSDVTKPASTICVDDLYALCIS